MSKTTDGPARGSTKLDGPIKSKNSIKSLEDWLRDACRTQKKVEEIDAEWQYLTGHEPRKIRQYLLAIQSQGKIRLFNDKGEQCCVWVEEQHEEKEAKPKRKLSDKAEEFFEDCRIKDEMKAGHCKDEVIGCPPPFSEGRCKLCSRYIQYKEHAERAERLAGPCKGKECVFAEGSCKSCSEYTNDNGEFRRPEDDD